MSAAKSQVPSWINVRLRGECCNCGATVEKGESCLYEWATQKYLRCNHCDATAPQPSLAVLTATGTLPEETPQPWPRAAAVETQTRGESPEPAFVPAAAPGKASPPNAEKPRALSPEPARVAKPNPLAQLISAVESFASANVATADVRRCSDRMIAAVVRAATE